jgi:hypothetical protein
MFKLFTDILELCEASKMGREERQQFIADIEKMRGSKVITYITSTKPPLQIQIDLMDRRIIYDHLLKIGEADKIDLFIYSLGGATPVAWALTNLIREFTNDFTVLVPSFAFSCATSIALGANKIIMGKMGTLGPVDPQVANEFNPIINGQNTSISVEDIAGYISLLKDKMDLRSEDNLTDLLSKLCTKVHPLALGNAFRHYIKARDDTRKLLELHMNPKDNDTLIKNIVDMLVEKLYFHGHHISRTEAKGIGLNIQKAEEIGNGVDKTLDSTMWELFKDYEKELSMQQPYHDRLSAIGDKRLIPVKMVESRDLTSAFIIEQEYSKINAPKGSYFTKVDNIFALAFIKADTLQIVPFSFPDGTPTNIKDELYIKRENVYWKEFTKDLEIRTPDKA